MNIDEEYYDKAFNDLAALQAQTSAMIGQQASNLGALIATTKAYQITAGQMGAIQDSTSSGWNYSKNWSIAKVS